MTGWSLMTEAEDSDAWGDEEPLNPHLRCLTSEEFEKTVTMLAATYDAEVTDMSANGRDQTVSAELTWPVTEEGELDV